MDPLSDLIQLHPLVVALVLVVFLVFAYVDKDRDGFVSVNEIKAACAVNRDGDGVISDAEKNAGLGGVVQTMASMAGVDGDQKFSLRDLLMACAAKAAAAKME